MAALYSIMGAEHLIIWTSAPRLGFQGCCAAGRREGQLLVDPADERILERQLAKVHNRPVEGQFFPVRRIH